MQGSAITIWYVLDLLDNFSILWQKCLLAYDVEDCMDESCSWKCYCCFVFAEFWPLMGNFSTIVRSNASSVSDADSHKTSFWLSMLPSL